MERLQKAIANAGITSRRKAEELILEGKVKVNGIVVDWLGAKVNPTDEITVESQTINETNKVYYLLNKPKKYICSLKDDKGRKVVTDLIDTPYRIYPCGRLDYDTMGLLILTNDGDFNNSMIHPSFQIEKTYEVVIKGTLTPNDIKLLNKGIRLDDGTKYSGAYISLLNKDTNTTRFEITIHEGKNREIRNMMAFLGHEITLLKRIRFGCLELGNLKTGEYRRLKPFEIKKLRELASHGKE